MVRGWYVDRALAVRVNLETCAVSFFGDSSRIVFQKQDDHEGSEGKNEHQAYRVFASFVASSLLSGCLWKMGPPARAAWRYCRRCCRAAFRRIRAIGATPMCVTLSFRRTIATALRRRRHAGLELSRVSSPSPVSTAVRTCPQACGRHAREIRKRFCGNRAACRGRLAAIRDGP